MHCQPWLCAAHSKPGLNVNIVVNTINICVCMVNDIVFYVPHEAASAQYIQGKSSDIVHPFVLAETAMRAVVHYIEADRGYHATQYNTFEQGHPNGGFKEYEVNIHCH